jgi:hypothetical protein
MTAGSAVVPARPLAAQAHALRATAMFIEHAGISGLPLSADEDRITIQMPAALAGLDARIAAVARLAAAAGGQAAAHAGRVTADGDLAGHAVLIFTPARDTP